MQTGEVLKGGYRRRQLFAVLLLVLYPVLAFTGPHNGRAEFYPFFNWNLFASSGPIRSDWVILVHDIDGEPLPEPRLFFDLKENFSAARRNDVRVAKQVDDVARAYIRKDEQTMSAGLQAIEALFLADASAVTYEIAQILYDPVDRYRTGAFRTVRVIERRSVAP